MPELAPGSAPDDANQGAENLGETPPKAPEAPEHPVKPEGEHGDDHGPENLGTEAAEENAEKVGAPTENNGKADNLNFDEYAGQRRDEITKLQEDRSGAVEDKEKIGEAIDALDSEVKGKEKKSSILGTISKVVPGAGTVLNAIDGVAELMGKDFEPIKDIANNVQNTDEAREKLKELETSKEEDIRAIDERIAAVQADLEQEVVANFLTSTAHTTDMGAATTRFIDQEKIEVDEDMKTADAQYDSRDGSITMSGDLFGDVQQSFEKLKADGVVDENGNIVDQHAFDASEDGDKAIGAVSLIAAHETQHAHDDHNDKLGSGQQLAVQIADGSWDGVPGNFDPGVVEAVKTAAGELGAGSQPIFYAMTELPTYRNQEAADLQAGRQKKFLMTTDEQGALLPAEQAAANLMAMYAGQPLAYGPQAGQTIPGDAMGAITDQIELPAAQPAPTPSTGNLTLDQLVQGRSRYGGDEIPGRSRYGGIEIPGRSRYGGDEIPGRSRYGGVEIPGRSRYGGEVVPGRSRYGGEVVDGLVTPGRSRYGGDVVPGRSRYGGEVVPGRSRYGGEVVPGRSRYGGEVVPGVVTPGRSRYG